MIVSCITILNNKKWAIGLRMLVKTENLIRIGFDFNELWHIAIALGVQNVNLNAQDE
jgi:hypothetical protein